MHTIAQSRLLNPKNYFKNVVSKCCSFFPPSLFTVSVDKLECAVDICFEFSLIFFSSVCAVQENFDLLLARTDTKLRVFHFVIVLVLELSFSIAIYCIMPWVDYPYFCCFFFGLLVIRDEHDGILVEFDKISNFDVKYGVHILKSKHLSHYVQFNFYFIVECVQ